MRMLMDGKWRIKHVIIRIDDPFSNAEAPGHGHDLAPVERAMIDDVYDIFIPAQVILGPWPVEMQFLLQLTL